MSAACIDRRHPRGGLSRLHTWLLACVFASVAHSAAAQHDGHTMPAKTASENATASKPDTPTAHADHAGHVLQEDRTIADDPHAGHVMRIDDTSPDTQSPKEPIPVPSAADRAAAFPDVGAHAMHGDRMVAMLFVDRLETWSQDDERGEHWELQGWLGSDLHRVWLRSEGERENGATASADIELLYGHSVTPWWDVVAGLRHDFAPGAPQDWAAFGVQGMAPYKFEVQATAYLGHDGRSAARLETEYDVLLTNRLILQPTIELEFRDRRDRARDIGAGLSKIDAGLRLRYEFTRRFAPYLGVVHERVETADGREARETRWVGGLRLWF